MKKVSRKGLMILALLIVTVIYPVVLHLDIQRYEAWKQAELEKYPQWAPYIDFNPYFTGTPSGLLITISGMVIVSTWLLLGIWRKKLKLLAILILLMVPSTMVSVASAGYYEKTVDVLAAQDEEFRFEFPAGWERYLGWEMYIDGAFGHFYDTFNIRLKLRGWINWESNDAEHNLHKLLSEAIDETGFVSGETTYNGYVIDLLLVFCGHLTLFDQSGWSYPPWRALIIHWWPNYPKTQTLMHEFSHQFMAEHCSSINSCVMAMADSWYWPAQWCSTCQATINENSDRFWRWVETATGGGAGGGCTLEGTEPEL